MEVKLTASSRTKANIALVIAALFLALAAALTASLFTMSEASHPSPSGVSATREAASDEDGFPVVDWGYWTSVNPDIVGWVSVPGTAIGYPIVQAPADKPDYYLSHDVYGNYNIYGCPYLDAGCSDGGLLGSKNAVIFGHHMNDGSMFSAFAEYNDAAFAEAHERILVQTPSTKQTIHVKAVACVPGQDASKRTSFDGPEDFAAWYSDRMMEAGVLLDAEVQDRTISFVTCSYNYWDNERTIVYTSAEANVVNQDA